MNIKQTPRTIWLTVVAALCAGTIAPLAADPVQAVQADAFVASTAVATHWRKGGSATNPFPDVYMTKFDELSSLVIDSGIRHIRDTGSTPDFIKKIQMLSDAGVKSIITIHPAAGIRPNSLYWAAGAAYSVDDYVRVVGRDVIAYLEMNNELDMASQRSATYWRPNDTVTLSDDPESANYYINYIKAATADAKASLAASGDGSIASVPLIGPSFATTEKGPNSSYTRAGDLSQHVDFSNIHHYYLGREPETSTIRGIDYVVENCAREQAPGKGMIATEGGESTIAGTSKQIWPAVIQGRYMPRYFLTHFLKGFTVTAAYELVDESRGASVPNTNKEDNFGLIKNDLTPKPAYHAVKNMLSVLKDPGPSFEPATLDYAMSGGTDNVNTAFFQKRNGDFYLCLWLGVSSYDSTGDGSIFDNPPQSVTLALPAEIQSARIFILDDTGAMTSAAASIAGNAITVSVTDRVTIVRLSATSNGGEASMPTGLRAAPASGQIALKWAPVFEATSYTVKRASSASGPFTVVASGLASPEYTDTGLTDGTTVYYKVTATAPGGESVESVHIAATPFKPIIDNADGLPEVTLNGAWTASTAAPFGNNNFPVDYYNTNFIHDGNTAKGTKSVVFTPTITTAGNYNVYIRWTATSGRSNNTPVEVTDSEGTHQYTVNQRINSGTWVLLGTFKFAAGATGNVTIKNDSTNGHVIADAVRLVLDMPRSPAGLTASTDAPPVALSWTAVTGATGYTVRRATSQHGPWTLLADNVPGTSYSDAGTEADTVYYYTVSTVGGTGEGAPGYPVAGASMRPVITSAATKNGVVGEPFSYQIIAQYSPTAYDATGLPSGLAVNQTSGMISGTAATSGTYNVVLSASNAAGSGTAALLLDIASELFAPVITSATTAVAHEGEQFLYELTASQQPDTLTATPMPAGLDYDPATSMISGIPTASGTYNIMLSATNRKGTGTASLELVVEPVRYPPSISSPTSASGAVGSAFSYQIDANYLPSGFAATGLPEGLSIDASTGAITGTPLTSGKFTVTLSATNGAGDGQAQLVITIDGHVETESVVSTGLTAPVSGVCDSAGNLYVVDGGAIKKIAAANNAVSTHATVPQATCIASSPGEPGVFYVGGSGGAVNRILADGTVVTPSLASGLDAINGIAVDAQGAVYVSSGDTVKKISPAGEVSTLVDTGLNAPGGLAINESTGRLYVADTGNNAVKEINTETGAVTATATGFNTPEALAIDDAGLIYVTDTGSGKVLVHDAVSKKTSTVLDTTAGLNAPAGIAIDGDGFVYVVDTGNASVSAILASPMTTVELQNTSAATRSRVTLDGAVRASPGATYQWFKDGVAIPGATGSTYEIAYVLHADAGVYSVIASNPLGKSSDSMVLLVTGVEPPLSDDSFEKGGGATSLWMLGALALLMGLRRIVSRRFR
ncbi:putative Ig domain-containing protein [Ereboglobus luteus]|uniref:Fibronectin type-III domain-containing protein n=1 Tax=Ereboglobus luteus TaxID=1796921 RepID=A0A2U8E535_9BACT|nr:putative Ig domain-containing protein [Ereboglobus luteus]AWI09961.1 hypothetical protein CKA38_12515 [Ereboglobus luteus]